MSYGVPHIGRFTVVTGHYGCGKTNLAINLALDLAAAGEAVTLVDLDVVNPYFRSSDYATLLTDRGVKVISPVFAGTTLDVPALSPAIAGAFEETGAVIMDVGGDDAGATALGRYAGDIERLDYDFIYVVNAYRTLTATPAEAAQVLREIEVASHLKATAVANNSHLRDETTLDTVLDSLDFERETAAALGLPLRFTTVPKDLAAAGELGVENAYPVEVYVRFPWESGPGGEEEVVR